MLEVNSDQSIGQLLRSTLDEHSLSMRKLSELTDIDTSTISRIINDKRKATLDHLEKFSSVLAIPLAKLLEADGYSVIPEKKSSSEYDATIEQLVNTSDLLSTKLSLAQVESQLADYEDYAKTTEGKQRILYEFTEKLKAAGGIGPFADQMKKLFTRFKTQKGNTRELAIIGSALLYFIVPVDVIPDYLFAVGYLDDAVAVQIASNVLVKKS
ncbi:DUF1232 domain-containing protein [Sporosarcina sp. PTS2304]|uniref:DUF1232 domain-containing protein n=1 Tax=Sporosarcina sp. PTS2304 TaxID=2283194 RepID=UPI000E0CD90F|nr:DUF1232 domain-containing protein [Sporosarcina sp. PTS2304]AXH99356.1 DUF1232 domain-containing protein [Sporosarcina sp. PTS2304]